MLLLMLLMLMMMMMLAGTEMLKVSLKMTSLPAQQTWLAAERVGGEINRSKEFQVG